jgi:hypothetical protein
MSLPFDDPEQVQRYHRDDTTDTIGVDLFYPRLEGHVTHIEIGLMDVRAADGIRVWYDFDRDGFVVEQPWTEEIEITQPGATYRSFDTVEHWQEVGFFQSWALKNQNKTAEAVP